jgi:hypothetical protein
MHSYHKSYGSFMRLRLTADPKRFMGFRFCFMADIAYLGLALFCFAVLALTVLFCERL